MNKSDISTEQDLNMFILNNIKSILFWKIYAYKYLRDEMKYYDTFIDCSVRRYWLMALIV